MIWPTRIILLLSAGFCSWSFCVMFLAPPGNGRIQNLIIVVSGMIAFVLTSMGVAGWVNSRSKSESRDNDDT